MRELLHELEEPLERHAADLHGDVLLGQHNAVLVVVDVRAVLRVPRLTREREGDEADGLARGVVEPAGVAQVLGAELAARVGLGGPRLLLLQRGGYGLGVLLGLGEVDRDVQVAVARGGDPLAVAGDAVGADVVAVLGQAVEVVRGGLGRVLVALPERADDLARARGDAAHEASVQQIAARDAGVARAAGDGVVQKAGEDALQLRAIGGGAGGGDGVARDECPRGLVGERVEHEVGGVGHVLIADEPPVERVGDKVGDPPLDGAGAILCHCALPPRAGPETEFAHLSENGSARRPPRAGPYGQRHAGSVDAWAYGAARRTRRRGIHAGGAARGCRSQAVQAPHIARRRTELRTARSPRSPAASVNGTIPAVSGSLRISWLSPPRRGISVSGWKRFQSSILAPLFQPSATNLAREVMTWTSETSPLARDTAWERSPA